MIDDIKLIPKVGFQKLVQDVTSNYHYDTWAWISVSFAILFLLMFIGYFYTKNSIAKRIFFTSMIMVFLAILICVSAAIFEKNNFDNNRPAIIFAEAISIKTEPKNNAPDSFMLHEGSKVFILETTDNWNRIELTDGKKGWILASNLKELK